MDCVKSTLEKIQTLDVDQVQLCAKQASRNAVTSAQSYLATHEPLIVVRDIGFVLVVVHSFRQICNFVNRYGIVGSVKLLYTCLSTAFFRFFLSLPFIRSKVDGEVSKVLTKLEDDMIDRSLSFHSQLPEEPWSEDTIMRELALHKNLKHSDWKGGKVSGAVYHGGDDLLELQTDAYGQFSISNQLHPDVFPGIRKMDSEVVAMILDLFNAPKTGCGTSTSGGTESILLACLSARQKAYEERGITEPEIIAPITVHAAFDKAAYYFKMRVVHILVDPVSYKVDIKAVKRAINRNTVLLVGSAPNFPHGIIDDIEALSKLAVKYKLLLHVDACLGSFIVPFLEQAGVDAPLFDFRLPGVTSISCDTHKYGFAPKGSSVIMYRNEKLRAYQYYVTSKWTGGIYATPTLAGSRPGALMAGCWATMMRIGKEGYLQSCKDIVAAAKRVRGIVEATDDLYVIGDPIASVVAFSSKTINIYDLGDAMSEKGWHLNALQNPAAVHLACTRLTGFSLDTFEKDLNECLKQLKSQGSDSKSAEGTAALYGVAGSIQTVGVAERIAAGFLDNLYKI